MPKKKPNTTTDIYAYASTDIRDQETIYALHEAGHAITALYQGIEELSDTFSYVAINHTHCNAHPLVFKDHFNAELAIRLGGRAAETIILGKDRITSSATIDIERATELALDMTCNLGFSDLGPINVGQIADLFDDTREIQKMLMGACERLLKQAEAHAQKVLIEHKDELLAVTNALKQTHILKRQDVLNIISGTQTQLSLDL